MIKEQTELDSLLKNIFQLETKIGFIDSNNREMELQKYGLKPKRIYITMSSIK